jgi:hypothetical protein
MEAIYLKFEIEPKVVGQQVFLVQPKSYAELACIIKRLEDGLRERKIKVEACSRMVVRDITIENIDQEFERLLKETILHWTHRSGRFKWLLMRKLWQKCKILGEVPVP